MSLIRYDDSQSQREAINPHQPSRRPERLSPFVDGRMPQTPNKSLNTIINQITTHSEDRMHLFDSPTLQRQGSGTRLQTVYGLLATILVLLTVGTSTGWAQSPTLATQAASTIICAGTAPTFDLTGDPPNVVVYNQAHVAYNFNAENDDDISANFGDETVYHLPGADINGQVGGAFEFTFYGTTHDLSQEGIYIGSNGFIRFENYNPNDNIEANEFGINAQNIPAVGGPNDAVYFLNIDLFPQGAANGENITWGYDAGNDALVITFTNVSQFNVNNPGVYPYQQVTVQVVLWADGSANPGRVDVNLEDWPDPIYIPNAHTIGVENNCGTVATTAGAPGAHNQTNWANAQAGVAPDNGVNETSWTFTPAVGALQAYSARLVLDGGDGIRSTYDLNGAAQGDDIYAGSEIGGSPTSLTGNVMNTPGTYDFYAIVEYANCYQAQTALPMSEVVVDPQPTTQVIQPAGTSNFCEGPTYVFSVTGTVANSTFSWSLAPLVNGVDYTIVLSGANAGTATANITFLTAGSAGSQAGTARTIAVTETGPAPENCAITSNKNITVYTTPAGTVNTGSPSYCAANTGTSTFVDFASFSGAPAGTYAWSLTNTGTTGANLGATGTQAMPDLSLPVYSQPSAPQVVTLNLTATNGPSSLCSFTTSTTFTVNPSPTAKTITPSPTTYCTNQPNTFSLTGFAGNSYAWTFTGAGAYSGPDAAYPGNSVLNKTSVQITFSGAGAASVTATETTPAGCVRANTLAFTVSATPAPTITGSTVPCQFRASFPATPTAPSFATNPTPQEYLYSVVVPNGANGYRWSVSNGGTIVAVNGVPGTYANPYPGPATFQTGATNITVRWPNTGAGTVTVSEQGGAPNNCVGSGSLNVVVGYSPQNIDFDITGPGINGSTPPCQNQPTSATAYNVVSTAGPAGQHNIQLNGGTAAAAAPYVIGGGGTVISGSGNGTFGSVTWTGTSGTITHDYSASVGGCTSREVYAVTIQPLPSATITGATDVCGNSVGSYTATNPQNVSTYQWGWSDAIATFPFVGASGGTINTPGPSAGAQTTTINFNNTAGTYYLGLRLVGPAPSNCAVTQVLGITLTPQPSTPVLAGFAPTTVCDSVSIVYTVTGTAGNDIRLTVVGGRFTAPSAGTSIAFAATGAPQNFTVEWINSFNGGTGSVSAIQYTTGVPSCTSATATSPTITIVRQPNTTVVGPSPVCGNTTTNYVASNPQFINTYAWGWSNDAIGTGFPAAAPPGTVIVTPNASSTDVNWGNTASTYYLTVQVVNTTGGANCTKLFTRTVILTAQPNPPDVGLWTGPAVACDSSNPSGYHNQGVDVFVPAGHAIRFTVSGGNSQINGPGSGTTHVATAGQHYDFFPFWDFGGNGGTGVITAIKYTIAGPGVAACTSSATVINVTVNPLPPIPTVTITPDPPGYCADAVPVNFLVNNTAAYVGAPNQYTAAWTWSGTPAGFAGAPNDPAANTVLNEQYTVTNWTSTPTVGFTATFDITITNTLTGCSRDNDYSVVVQPRPSPVISGPNGVPTPVCQQPTDPAGSPANTVYVNPRYVYSTPQVAGNYYNWSITDGYIVAYSVTGPGGPWIQTAASSTMPGGSPIVNASAVQVVFYGTNPAAVKVAEITAPTSPPGCQTTTPDYAVQIDALTPYNMVDPSFGAPVCFNDAINVDQNGSDVGHNYQLQISTDGGTTFANVTAATPSPSQAGTGAVLSWAVPTGAGTQAVAPGFYDFRSVATSPAGCLSYTGTVTIEVVPNPDTIPMSPLTDTICDTTPGIPFTVGPTVQDFVFYDLEREGPVGVWTSYDTFFYFGGAPATDVLTDNSNPPGGPAPAGIVYNYRVVAVDLFTNCSTILDTAVITIVEPCVPVIGAVNTPPGYNDDEVCIYGGYEEHLRTYKLASVPPCLANTPGATLNWFTATPPGSLVTGAVREQGGDTAVVEWYTTGGTQYGWIIAEITLPASYGGCASYDTLQVRVYPLPVPVIGTGPAAVCQNQQNVQYTATLEAGDTYKWEVVGGLIDSPVGATGAGTTPSPSTYTGVNANVITIDWLDIANPTATITLTQTSTVGCLARTTRTIVVNPTPTPSINGPAAPCGLDVVTYTTQNNAPNNSYQWSVQSGPGTIQSGATTNSVQFLTGAAGSSTVLRVTETIISTNCSKFNDFTINPVLKPTPAISRTTPLPGNVGNACINTPMTYSIPTVVGNSRLWSIVGGTITSATNANPVSVTWNVLGTQSLTVTEWVNSSQCTTATTQQVVVEAIPAPSITGPVIACGTTSSNYSTPLVAGHTYLWSLTNAAHGNFVGSTTSNSSTIMWNNPTPGTTFAAQVNVTETATLAGCSGSALLGVTIHRQPTVPVITRTTPAGNANQACTSDQINYAVTNNAGSTFLWNVTGGNILSGQGTSTTLIEWTVAGNNTVTLTETTAGNTACFATGTLNVTVEEKPTPTVTGPTVVCGNAISTYSTPAVAGTTYQWTIGNAAHGTITSSPTSNSINITWNNPAAGSTFTATVTVVQTTGTGNCSGTANATVTIHRQPTTPVITRTSPAGNANQACTSDNITYSVTNNAGSTYVWNVTGGNIQSGQGTSSAVIEWTVAGNNTVTLTESTTGNTACVATGTLNVAVENKPTPTVSGPAVVCGNVTSNYSTPAVAGDTYAWVIGNAAHGTITSSTTTNAITVIWNNPTAGTTFAANLAVTQTTPSGNCTGTANINVTVHRQPTVPVISRVSPAGNANQACTSDNITYSVPNNAGSTYLWNVVGGNIVSGQGTSSVVILWTVAGNNTVTLTETTTANTVCTATGTLNVAVEADPVPTVSGPAVVCGNQTAGYSTPAVAGNTYAWTIGNPAHGTITSSTTTNAITVLWNNPAVNTTFTATVTVNQATASANCTGAASITVTVHRQPTPPVISRVSPAGNANQACTSDNITYSVPNNLGSTFVWNVSGGNIQSGQNTNQIVVEWTLAGNGTVTVTETTQGNTLCTATSTLNVAVENKPTPTVTGPAVVCGNATSNYSTPAVAGDTYVWSIANAAHGTITSSTTTNAITVMWNNPAAGTTFPATVTVTQTTASGNCTGTANISVTVHRQPTTSTITRITAGGLVNEACTGQTIQYSIPNNAGSSYNWTVTGANVNSGQGTNAITVTWNVAGTGTLTVVESTTANTACFATSTQSVTVEAKPTPAITGPSIACGNTTSTFSTPNVAGNSYAWTLNNAAFGTFTSATNTNSANILWNNPTPGATFAAVVTVTETTPTGNCVTSTTRNVTIYRQPTVQTITRVSPAGNANQACSGDNITYSVVNNAGSTYVWNVVGGNIMSGQTTTSLVVEWTTVGNGSVSVTETTAANTACSATSTLNVSVEAKPNPSITGPAVVCGNVTTNYSTPAVAGNTYLWSINAALPPHGTITSSTTTNAITVIWNNPAPNTTFSAVLNVTESTPTGNCVTSTTLNVTVHRQPTPPSIVRVSPAGNPNQACQGDNITYSVTNNAGSTYQWTVTGGNIIGTSTTNSVVVEWTVAGNGSLSVTETTATNTACSATATLLVGIEAKPNPSITGSTIVCGNSIQNYSTPAAAGNTYLWTIGNAAHGTITSSATSNAIQITWNNPTPGTTFPASVTVTETSPSGNCTGTATVAVTVHRQPVANAITRVSPAGNANQACTGDNITYAVTNHAGSNWNWTVTGGNILSGQATNSVVVEWTTVGNQVLTVNESTTALTMCTFTNTLNVAVEAKPTPIISGPTVVCINTIHTHSTPFVVGNTYSWAITPDAGAPVPVFAPINGWNTSNSITLQWIQTGLHTLAVTETSNSGNCVGTTSIQVRVNPIPTPAITSTTGYGTPTTARPGVVCAGSTHTYSVTPTPGNVFFWTVSGGSIVSGQNTPNLTVTWGSAGMGTIGITETIPGSTCMGTDLDTIDKRPVPTPSITGNVNPCANGTTIYTTPFVTGNTYTWTVNGPAGTTFFVVPGTPNSISVTWGSLVFPATFSGSVSVTESVAAVLPPGTCLSSNTLNVTVRPNPPAVTITASQNPVCASDLSDVPPTINPVTYTTPAVVGVTYTWSVTSNGTIVSGQGSNSVVARWTNATTVPTTGTITVVLTTPFGCTSTGSFVATINPLPNPVISGPTAVCQNTIHNYSSAGIPGNSYTWSLSGGNIIRTGQGTPNITVEWTLPGSHTLTLTETTIATGCTAMNTINVTVNPIPTAQITASGPTTFCQGGDVTLTAPLGFASYIWNTGQTGRSIVVRSTGSYYVLVTDVNGCSNTSDTITVNVFPTTLPIITTTGPTTFCEGGSITLSAPSGFTAYLWSTGASTQSIVVTESGTYTVTVADNNGCTGTSTEVDVFVNPRPTPVLTVIGTTTICAGDSVEVRAPAGYPSYTWVATSGTDYGTGRTIFIKTSDTVYVTVSDVNGCPGTSDVVRVVLSSVTAPTVTASGTTQFCQGGSVTLSAPTGFANYIWSNGSTNREVTITESGTYTVTVTDNSLCAATSATTTVTVFPTPAKPTIDRTGDELVANGPATTYQWYRNGTALPGATNDTLTGTAAGAYRVEIADANGCTNLSDPFDFITTGVDDVTAGYVAEMRVFPNPTNGQFTIETEISQAGPVRIEIVNSIGEKVLTLNSTTDGGKFQVTNHLGDLASGVYSVILTSGNERWTVRLVRQ